MGEMEFAVRFEAREAELRDKWCAVFGSEVGLAGFRAALSEAYEARPAALRVLDRKRPAADRWFADAAYRGVFLDIDDLGGSLAEAEGVLPYFGEAGMSLAELRVAPEPGPALEHFAAACREEGIDLCVPFRLDAVPADDAWVTEAAAGDAAAARHFFLFDGWEVPAVYEQTLPGGTGHFVWSEALGRVVMCQTGAGFYDLNYGEPAVLTGMLARLFSLADAGVAMVRLQGTDRLWKAPGTNGRGLPENARVLALIRLACELVCPSFVLAGPAEPAGVHLATDETLPDELWNALAMQDGRLLKDHLKQTAGFPALRSARRLQPLAWRLDYARLAGFGMAEEAHKHFLNTYYTGAFPGSSATGVWTPAGICGSAAQLAGLAKAQAAGDEEAAAQASHLLQMLTAVLMTLPGVPMVAAGDEFGGVEHWDEAAGRSHGAFSELLAGRRNDATSVQAELFWKLAELADIRRENPCFAERAEVSFPEVFNDNVLAIRRQMGPSVLLGLFNLSREEQMVWLDEDAPYTDALTGEETAVRGLKLSPQAWRWLTQGDTREEEDGPVWTLDDL